MDTNRTFLAVPAGILGLCAIIATLFLSGGLEKMRDAGDAISVTGSAQRIIKSDRAKWVVSFTRSGDLSPEGLKKANKQIESDLKAFRSFLEKNGIAASQITLQPVYLNTMMNYTTNTPSGYQVSQGVIIESDDVTKMEKIAQDSSALLNDGILLSTNSLEYFYGKLADLRIEMLAQATQDAKKRAEKIAESADASLGHLKDANMGVIQITAVNSTDVSDYGTYDTSSIDKQITAVVRASFGVR